MLDQELTKAYEKGKEDMKVEALEKLLPMAKYAVNNTMNISDQYLKNQKHGEGTGLLKAIDTIRALTSK